MSQSQPNPEAEPTAIARILLVDDCSATTRAFARFIERHGFQVDVSADVATAIRAIETDHPHLILTDYLLPDGDGFEITKFAAKLVPKPIVYMLTGWNIESDVTSDPSLGIDRLLTKPVLPGELIRLISQDLEHLLLRSPSRD